MHSWMKKQGNKTIKLLIDCIRMKNMDEWLKQKRLNEAERYAKYRDLEEKEEISRQIRDEVNYTSYKNWLKKQMLRERHDRESTTKMKAGLADQ